MNCKHFAQKAKELRLEHNYTIESLGKELDVGKSRVSMWESVGAVPRWDVLLKLAHLYGVTVDELLEGQEKEEKQPSRKRGFSGKLCTRR